MNLSLYRSPMLLLQCSVSVGLLPATNSSASTASSDDDCLFSIQWKDYAINFRAVNSNARMLWVKQLEKAIKQAKTAAKFSDSTTSVNSGIVSTGGSSRISTPDVTNGMGRILVEVVCVRHLIIPEELKVRPQICYLNKLTIVII